MAANDEDLQPVDQIDPATGLPVGQQPFKPGIPGKQPGVTLPTGGPVPDPLDNGTSTSVSTLPPKIAAPAAASPAGLPPSALSKLAQSNPYASAPNGNEGVIDSLYAKYGMKDGGRGSGFADRAYWLEHPSEILNGRLEHDLNGTGTDNPEGTPGSGLWQNSGRNQPQPQGMWSGPSGPSTAGPQMPGGMDTASLTDSPVIRQLILQLLGGGAHAQ